MNIKEIEAFNLDESLFQQGVAHYEGYSGLPRKINIQNLGINIKPEDFSEVKRALLETKGRDSAVSISQNKGYSVEGPAENLLGDISLRLGGIVRSYRDGRQEFSGNIKSYNDSYDFLTEVVEVLGRL